MSKLISWSGDGLSGNLTTGSAGPGDTAPSFITGTTPTIEPVSVDSPAIRFAQLDTSVNYGTWIFSVADLYAYAIRSYEIFTGFVATGQQSLIQVVNAGETLLSWGVALTSTRLIRIIDKNGVTQATGTIPLVAGEHYRFDLVVNGSQYNVYAYLGDSATVTDQVSAVLAGPVPGGRLRWGNAFGTPQAPPFYGDNLSVYDVPALPDIVPVVSTDEQIIALRKAINEPTDAEPYTNAMLAALLIAEGSVNRAAASVWRSKAASASSLVDMTESGSSRRLSQLQDNALKMAALFEDEGDQDTPVVARTYVVGSERV
jgi:hypothetical protein